MLQKGGWRQLPAIMGVPLQLFKRSINSKFNAGRRSPIGFRS